MYSGSDSSEGQNLPQWALHPSAYQNMQNSEVDWAALAQQWIIMKEAGPPPMPDTRRNVKEKPETQEGGEAPMDVEGDKESKDSNPSWNSGDVNQPQPPGVESWNWNSQQSWSWNSTWTPPGGCPPPPTIGAIKAPLLPTPGNYSRYETAPTTSVEAANDNATGFQGSHRYNTSSTNDYPPGYWTSSGASNTIPKQINIKPHNRKYSKVNVPVVQRNLPPSAVPATVTPLDSAKRKALPAWIREGLEKMERDKLKQLEKDKQKTGKDVETEKIKLDEKETMEILKSTIQERRRSRFDSDAESDEEVDKKKPRDVTPEPIIPLSHDELMLKVRKLMTEVLLKVTNKEIELVCKEELQRHLKRSKASDQRVSAPSGANISARLGLGMYGGDSGDSDSSDDDSRQDKKDSDSDLKESIKRKKADFARTERDIEGKLSQAERRKAGNESRSPTPDTNENDSQVDQRYQGYKSRSNDSPERTSQHSKSYQDDKYSKRSRSNSYNSDSDDGRNTNARRSSSSGSSDVHVRSKQRSETPDRKYRTYSERSSSKMELRRSRSKSPRRRHSRSSSRSRRDSRTARRSRSSSYSRSRRSRSNSYKRSTDSRRKSRRSRSRSRPRRSDSRSTYSRSRRSSSRSRKSYKRRSRSGSSNRSKRSRRD